MVRHRQGTILPLISLDRSSGTPIYRQIETQLREAILSGALKSGTRLPSSRVIASELAVSRPTIMLVLETLAGEGLIDLRHGSGTFVSFGIRLPPMREEVRSADMHLSERLSQVGRFAMSHASDLGVAEYRPFLPNFPAFDAFPWALWHKSAARAGRDGLQRSPGYSDPQGFRPLRRCIAEYLALHRGDACDPDQILITAGAHSAFALAALALADVGDGVLIENPGPITVRTQFRALGLRLIDIGTDAEGMLVDDEVETKLDARLAFIMPSRQHPLGMALSLPRRLALLAWAQRQGSWIIEDDYDSEFRYIGRPLPSMRSIDRSGRVIYVGTFSKALLPGLRVGYMVLPPDLVGVFRALIGMVARSAPIEHQATLADFIEQGHFVTHIRRMRDLYATRRDAFTSLVRDAFGESLDVSAVASGMNLLAWLPPSVEDQAACRALLTAGIKTYPLSDYGQSSSGRGGLLMGFTGQSAERMREPILKMADVLHPLLG